MKQTGTELTEDEIKQRRIFYVAPIIVLPFLTFLLWSLGLVGGEEKGAINLKGLNLQLPDAKLKEDKSWNKLSFYEQADKDSLRHEQALKDDPFLLDKKDSSFFNRHGLLASYNYDPMPLDSSEYKVSQSLTELNAVLSKTKNEETAAPHQRSTEQMTARLPSHEVDRLEHMLRAVSEKDTSTDPETAELNRMMDKILDIQHPERVTNGLEKESERNKTSVYPILAKEREVSISMLGTNDTLTKLVRGRGDEDKTNGFYSLGNDVVKGEGQNAIEAFVEEAQTLETGSVVKLVSGTDVYIGGVLLPKGSALYGKVSLSAERLTISINSIRNNHNILPVALSVYDMDGMQGIYISGSLSRDVAKQSGSEAVNTIGITSLDPSIGAQAAGAGIAAAKSLVNKKTKQLKVTIPAGYKILLRDEHQK